MKTSNTHGICNKRAPRRIQVTRKKKEDTGDSCRHQPHRELRHVNRERYTRGVDTAFCRRRRDHTIPLMRNQFRWINQITTLDTEYTVQLTSELSHNHLYLKNLFGKMPATMAKDGPKRRPDQVNKPTSPKTRKLILSLFDKLPSPRIVFLNKT